jgi:D-glycero-D-manno-heptose 1,7-bisphosphate phosphatase
MLGTMRPAVFLDRDDTLIENRSVTAGTAHPGDLFDAALVRLVPGVAEGCRRLREAGFALVVVSNQGGVARGTGTVALVEATNARMRGLLRAEGVELDGVYYCPYHPEGVVAPYNTEHEWRKPSAGMLLAAAGDLGLDLSSSWMIGDAQRDVEAAVAAGIRRERTFRIGEGKTFAQGVAWVLRGG